MTGDTAPLVEAAAGAAETGNDKLPRTGVWVFPDRPAPELLDLARHVEDLGLDELWIGDEGPARDPFALLAAASVATGRIRLATGVTNPYVRHPGVTAAGMLTIHELSRGRAVLGIGAGGHMSLAPFGLQARRPLERVREFLDVARAVATAAPTAGYTPPDVAISETAGGSPMPVFVGARGPRLNRLASERADGAFGRACPHSATRPWWDGPARCARSTSRCIRAWPSPTGRRIGTDPN